MKNLNLTPRAQKLIKEALKVALAHKNIRITHLHLFNAFLNLNNNQIEEAFLQFELDVVKIKEKCSKFIDDNYSVTNKKSNKPSLSDSAKSIFTCAKEISAKFDHKYIGLEHIFLAMFEVQYDLFQLFLSSIDFNFENIVDYIESKLEEDDLMSIKEDISKPEQKMSESFDARKYKMLNTYASSLNAQVISGKINNLHINEELIKKISEVLCRKTKNNPLIVGEAGVGKTALVESLAQAIVNNQCSDLLGLKQIYTLDIPMMIAGCKYRGEFEEKIKNLLKEIVNDPYIILFIDEIHTIIGAGNPENGHDVANILKPYLARGEISCIGATTFDEYRKTIADDPALSRRFQMIKIEEPTKEQTFDLIKNIKKDYETYHIIEFTDDVLRFIINTAEKYIEGRFPDKALDIIDQVGSKAKLKNFTKTPEMIKIESKIMKAAKKDKIASENQFTPNIQSLLSKYQGVVEKLVNKLKSKKYKITEDDVLQVVSDKTNIPFSDLKKQDFEKVQQVKKELQDNVVGQNEQIDQIYKCLIRAKAGFRNQNKPICSMLFAGSTGIGKTMTAKLLATNLFVNKNNFIFIDMSEYADKTAVNKLIGSNPGYIGYDKGGVLTEKVRKNPYSLILFDEIQKADEEVLFLLLQILEEGKLSDSSGKTIDFSNSIIVMTTNVGAQAVNNNSIGFVTAKNSIKTDVLSSVKKYFPPDLLNRLDEIVVFNPLQESQIKVIIEKEMNQFKKELSAKNIDIDYSEEVIMYVFKKIQFDNFGARQVIKTIQREIQTLIAEKILENKEISNIKISVKDNNICVT
jgi:ATP-dependent Clp protease ATP-binding subunit ClpC